MTAECGLPRRAGSTVELPGRGRAAGAAQQLGGRNCAICAARLGGDGQAAVREVKVSGAKATGERATGGRLWPRNARPPASSGVNRRASAARACRRGGAAARRPELRGLRGPAWRRRPGCRARGQGVRGQGDGRACHGRPSLAAEGGLPARTGPSAEPAGRERAAGAARGNGSRPWAGLHRRECLRPAVASECLSNGLQIAVSAGTLAFFLAPTIFFRVELSAPLRVISRCRFTSC